LYQLTELLFRAQHAQNLGPAELIDWLKRAIEQEDAEGDELEQRIENDEEAVKIVTIHSSKGLQYNIVIAPSLDMSTVIYHDDASYRNEETSEYISGLKNQFTPEEMEIVKKQMEQENRRLLYVTLTRAVYKAFIYRNTNSKQKNTTLSFFTEALNYSDGNLIEKKKPVEIAARVTYQFKSDEFKRKPLIATNFLLEHSNWKNMSYTMLAAELENRSRQLTGNLKNTYDRFIFSELAKGNITGNLLHFIFENINFSSDEKWVIVVERAIQRFAPARKEKYELNLLALIQNVLNAEIVTKDFKFNLSEINFDKRIHELEFDFPVSEFDPQLLSSLADENVTVNVKKFSEMEGVMNGKIDMFFEYKGQYFVLDWKSTFLGDSLEDYNSEALSAGMNDHNYHLQYLIYSLAAKKYLESRLNSFDYQKDFGGVFYLFVRGMREGKTEGIFHTKPSLKTIEQMENLLNANVNLNV
jgi:exodeoxyribonuclease V beta subunit